MPDDLISSAHPPVGLETPSPQAGSSPLPLWQRDTRSAPSTDPALDQLPARGLPRPAMARINRLEHGRALGQSVRTGQATTLERFAAATRTLATPGAVPSVEPPQVGLFTRALDTAKRWVGLPDDVTWMGRTMRDLRASSLGVRPEAGNQGHLGAQEALRALSGENGVSAFWNHEAMARHGQWGPDKAAVLGYLDRWAQVHGPELALVVSLACISALASAPKAAAVMDVGVLGALASADILTQLLSQDGRTAADGDTRLLMARAVLQQLAGNDQFLVVARALCPGVPEEQLPVLKRYLEADAAARAQASDHPVKMSSAGLDAEIDTSPDLEALEEGTGPLAASMAERVRHRAAAALSGETPTLTARERAEDFFWDNHFREDGEASSLERLKQHVFKFMAQLAQPADVRGPLNAMVRYGLAGADRHILADEAIKLAAEVASPALDPLVSGLSAALAARVMALGNGSPDPDDATVQGLAAMVMLDAWSPEHRARLSTADIVHGPLPGAALDSGLEQRPEGSVETGIATVCRQYLIGVLPDPGVQERIRSPLFQSVALATLEHRVRAATEDMHLGFDALLALAPRLGVELSEETRAAAEKVVATIEARSPKPAAPSAEAAGAVIGAFLDRVQFGNHIRVSNTVTGGVSTRGLSVNLANSQIDLESVRDKERPLNVRIDARADTTVEHVFRAGAATHGGEMFMGADQRWRALGGGGLQVGHIAPGHHGDLGRFAGGVDIAGYGYDRSQLEGAMWRVDRKIEEDTGSPTAPVFRQNDKDVRRTMGDMARMLHERAPGAKDEIEREQLLEEFIARFADSGLSVTLMQQQSSAHRSEGSLSGAVSVATGGDNGGRFGVSSGVSIEKGWSTHVAERDTTGTYQINNVRSGWYERKRANASLDGSLYLRAEGIPMMQLANASVTFGDATSSVRVRVPLRNGKIVPEKSFSDTETSDKALFKRAVLSDQQKWVDLFAYPHRHLGTEAAQKMGLDAVTAFFHKIDEIREANHVYYARERLHPAVAEKLDQLALLADQLPAPMVEARTEIEAQRARLMSADDSWMPASLITFQRNVQQDGPAANVAVMRANAAAAVEGEREIIFDTPGWAQLRQRERETPRG